jgi:arylformamidase
VSRDILDLSVWVDGDTYGPPSTNARWSAEEHHRGPGFWQVSSVCQSLHTGTHIDTPLHCFADGGTTSELRLEDICGEVALFDLVKDPNEGVTASDLSAADPGLVPGQVAVLATGWTDRMWGQFPEYYVRSPFLETDAAEWLVERRPKAVVFDFFEEYAARKPAFTSEEFVVHRILLGAGIYLVEQTTNLASLRGRRATIFPAFYKVQGVEGAPARVFAVAEDA